MKKTEYFVSDGSFTTNQTKQSIDSAKEKRDKFLEINKNKIMRIENESLQIICHSHANQYQTSIITLSYYEKE